jgi:hypothetical protein
VTPEEHYEHALDLITCIGANKDNPKFDTQQASVLAQTATAQALMGLLKLAIRATEPVAAPPDRIAEFVAEHRDRGHQLALNQGGFTECECGDSIRSVYYGDTDGT